MPPSSHSPAAPDRELYTLHQGDIHNLSSLASDWAARGDEGLQVDVTITSPPYGDVIEYGDAETDASDVTDRQIGFGESYDEYRESLRQVFRDTYAVTREAGSLWVIVNTYRDDGLFVNLPSDIVTLCQNLHGREHCPACDTDVEFNHKRQRPMCPACGWDAVDESWQHHDTLVWDKGRARPYPPEGGFRNVFESILVFKKSETIRHFTDSVRIADTNEFSHWWVDWPERYHPRGKIPSNIWQAVTPSQGAWGSDSRDHPAPFPPELIERIIRFTTEPGDTVFDPFAGTGTTVAQADIMNRRGIGVELSDKYVEMFPTLYQELADDWREQQREGTTLQQQQHVLAHLIWGLREIVYAKKLAFRLRREYGAQSPEALGLNSVFTFSSPLALADGEFAPESREITVVAVTETEAQAEEYLPQLQAYSTEPPWTSFDIDATVQTVARDRARAHLETLHDSDRRLYFYPRSQHYSFERSIGISEWERKSTGVDWYRQYSSPACPPLISPVRLEIDRSGDVPQVEYDPLSDPPTESFHTNGYTEELHWETTQTRLENF